MKGVADQKQIAPAHLNFKADFYLARGREDFVPAGRKAASRCASSSLCVLSDKTLLSVMSLGREKITVT